MAPPNLAKVVLTVQPQHEPLTARDADELSRLRSLPFARHCPANLTDREQLKSLRAEFMRTLKELRFAQNEFPFAEAWADPWAEFCYRRDVAAEYEDVDVHELLSQAEYEEAEVLRAGYLASGFTDADIEDGAPIYRSLGDCGRKHRSMFSADACSNVRRGTLAAPRPRSVVRRNLPPKPATHLQLVPPARPGTGSRSVPAAREPDPAHREPGAPAPASGAGSRRAEILDAVRSAAVPLSANAIVAAIGGRKAAVLAQVRGLVQDGALVATKGGFIAR